MTGGESNDHRSPDQRRGFDGRPPSERVDNLLHPLAVMIRGLLEHATRRRDRILIDDEENLLQALDAGVTIDSVFFSGESVVSERLLGRLPVSVPVHEIAPRTCKKIFEKDRVSRVFAVALRPTMLGLESLLATPGDIMVVDNLSISGNLGAIIRTSVALGAGGMVLLEGPLDLYDRRVIRASRGYLFSLRAAIATADELIRACELRRRAILVMTPDGDTPVDQLGSLPGALAIVFGGEKEGCSPALAEAATWRVRIPMNPVVESLNVSAAAAITLFSRRRAGG
jgi:23S rRNA (adenosine1067-2'-O)-methyltransferase